MEIHDLGMIPMVVAQLQKFQPCYLQTYFTAKGRINYFVIEGLSSSLLPPAEALSAPGLLTPLLSQEEVKLFESLGADIA